MALEDIIQETLKLLQQEIGQPDAKQSGKTPDAPGKLLIEIPAAASVVLGLLAAGVAFSTLTKGARYEVKDNDPHEAANAVANILIALRDTPLLSDIEKHNGDAVAALKAGSMADGLYLVRNILHAVNAVLRQYQHDKDLSIANLPDFLDKVFFPNTHSQKPGSGALLLGTLLQVIPVISPLLRGFGVDMAPIMQAAKSLRDMLELEAWHITDPAVRAALKEKFIALKGRSEIFDLDPREHDAAVAESAQEVAATAASAPQTGSASATPNLAQVVLQGVQLIDRLYPDLVATSQYADTVSRAEILHDMAFEVEPEKDYVDKVLTVVRAEDVGESIEVKVGEEWVQKKRHELYKKHHKKGAQADEAAEPSFPDDFVLTKDSQQRLKAINKIMGATGVIQIASSGTPAKSPYLAIDGQPKNADGIKALRNILVVLHTALSGQRELTPEEVVLLNSWTETLDLLHNLTRFQNYKFQQLN